MSNAQFGEKRKTVESINGTIHLLRGAPWSSGDANIFFVNHKTEIILFDAGSDSTAPLTIKALEDFGIPFEKVKAVVLTHCHADHSSGLVEMKKKNPNLQVWVSHREARVLEEADDHIGLWSLIGLKVTPIPVDRQLKENDTFSTGDHKWQVLETPGHSSGSLCFYEAEKKILISGDTVFSRGSVGRVDFPTGNPKELGDSLNRLSTFEVGMLLPGHMAIEKEKGSYWIKKACEFWGKVS
ncbi:MAG: MBL fold metallo-hydrolase [Candidatus Ranarchaeia archaeon]|jgi:glyoxylase-like metal-dependent hydrolase (beta-lactamase superfamily II)